MRRVQVYRCTGAGVQVYRCTGAVQVRGGGGRNPQRLHGVQTEVLSQLEAEVEVRRRSKVELVQAAAAWGQGIESLLPI